MWQNFILRISPVFSKIWLAPSTFPIQSDNTGTAQCLTNEIHLLQMFHSVLQANHNSDLFLRSFKYFLSTEYLGLNEITPRMCVWYTSVDHTKIVLVESSWSTVIVT